MLVRLSNPIQPARYGSNSMMMMMMAISQPAAVVVLLWDLKALARSFGWPLVSLVRALVTAAAAVSTTELLVLTDFGSTLLVEYLHGGIYGYCGSGCCISRSAISREGLFRFTSVPHYYYDIVVR